MSDRHHQSDEYFDRLSAAFSTLGSSRPPRPAPNADAVASEPGVVVDTFAALLAREDRVPGQAPAPVAASQSEPRVSEALVEEVTRRVLEQLAPDTVRAVVADIVSEVSERLVKEEIARIRKGANV